MIKLIIQNTPYQASITVHITVLQGKESNVQKKIIFLRELATRQVMNAEQIVKECFPEIANGYWKWIFRENEVQLVSERRNTGPIAEMAPLEWARKAKVLIARIHSLLTMHEAVAHTFEAYTATVKAITPAPTGKENA